MPTREDLQILQAQDLDLKVALTKHNKDGLGMKYVIDRLNSLYGDNFIKY